jgi:hypothetical protein
LTLITSLRLCSILNTRAEPLCEQTHVAFVLSAVDGPESLSILYRKKPKIAPPAQKLIQVAGNVEEDLLAI